MVEQIKASKREPDTAVEWGSDRLVAGVPGGLTIGILIPKNSMLAEIDDERLEVSG